MADSHSGASVVVVDPAKEAAERDRIARLQLSDGAGGSALPMYVVQGLEQTVPYTVKVVHASTVAKEKVQADVSAVLEECFGTVKNVLNHFNPNSEVSLVNALPAHMPHVMSPALTKVVHCALSVYANGGGLFDVACGPVVKFVKDFLCNPANKGKDYRQDAEYKDILTISTFPNAFRLKEADRILEKRDSRAILDLGGITKGYAVDAIVARLLELGYENCFADWGGDCRANGKNAKGELWSVGIVQPPDISALLPRGAPGASASNVSSTAPLLRVVQLDNEGLATSGDYENLFVGHDSKLYTTNWNPRTQCLEMPSDANICQATVKCYRAMYADALATVALNLKTFAPVRLTLDNWRWKRNAVTDFTVFVRKGQRMGKMWETSHETPALREARIRGSLPARVVVVGGGLAGLSAAIEAASCGAQVILLEKSATVGGNSAKATSGINGWGSRPQAQQGVVDGDKYFERDTFVSGVGGTCDPGLVKMLSVKSGDAIRWLCSFGIPLTVLSQLGGHSRKRTHRAPDKADGTPVPIGYTIMKTLEDYVRQKLSGRVTIMTECSAKHLMHEVLPQVDGSQRVKVFGVACRPKDAMEDIKLYADAVILATGGFGNDTTPTSLMREFAPHLHGRPTTNGPFATGDGVKMARAIGVQLVDMDKVQLHPTGFIDPKDPANPTKFLGPEALRGSGGILLNKQGERFVNELDLRSVVSNAINAQGNVYPNSNGCNFAYCVLSEAAAALFGPGALAFYGKKQGLFTVVSTVDALAQHIGCPVEALTTTLSSYEAVSTDKRAACPVTGKRVFPSVVGTKGPFYVAAVTPSIHYTMGGCLISPSAEVQSEYKNTSVFGSRRPVQGLFGAGEVTGGVHGRNRLGGNSLLECVVFGRIAGDRAATILQKKRDALSFTSWSSVTLREYREGEEFGHGSRVLRFNLPGATQHSGLKLGQFVAIRGEWDGQHLIGYYSPITLPDDQGVIGILVRTDKGTVKDWLRALKPGDAVEMRACGGLAIERSPATKQFLFENQPLRKIAMIAGGTGVAPMIQLIRAALKKPYVDRMESLHLIYAAEDANELTYRQIFENYQRGHSERFRLSLVLNNPPPKWTGGVGFIDRSLLVSCVPPPSRDLLVVICGPPVMQRLVKTVLVSLGHNARHVRTVDEESPSSKL